jgi:hypothetical protein
MKIGHLSRRVDMSLLEISGGKGFCGRYEAVEGLLTGCPTISGSRCGKRMISGLDYECVSLGRTKRIDLGIAWAGPTHC